MSAHESVDDEIIRLTKAFQKDASRAHKDRLEDEDDDNSSTSSTSPSRNKETPVARFTIRSCTSGDLRYEKGVIDPRNPPLSKFSNGAAIRFQLEREAHAKFDEHFPLLGTAKDIIGFLKTRHFISLRPTALNPSPVESLVVGLHTENLIGASMVPEMRLHLQALADKFGINPIPMQAFMNKSTLTAKIRPAYSCPPGHTNKPMQQRNTLQDFLIRNSIVGYRTIDIDDAFHGNNTSPFMIKCVDNEARLQTQEYGVWLCQSFEDFTDDLFEPFKRDVILATFNSLLAVCTLPSNIISTGVVVSSRLTMLPYRIEELKEAVLGMQAVPNTHRYTPHRYVGEMFMCTVFSAILVDATRPRGLAGLQWGEIVPPIDTSVLAGQCAGMSPAYKMLLGPCGSFKTQQIREGVKAIMLNHFEDNAMRADDDQRALQFIGTAQYMSFVLSFEQTIYSAALEAAEEYFGQFSDADKLIGNLPNNRTAAEWARFEGAHFPCMWKYKTIRHLSRHNNDKQGTAVTISALQRCLVAIVVTCAHSEPRISAELDKFAKLETRVVVFRDEVAASIKRITSSRPGCAYKQDVMNQYRNISCPALRNRNRYPILECEADATFLTQLGNPESYLSIVMNMMDDVDNRVPVYVYVGLAVGPDKHIDPVTQQLDYPQMTLMYDPDAREIDIQAHRIALSLLRPPITELPDAPPLNEDDDLSLLDTEPVDTYGPQPPPIPSTWFHFPASRKKATTQWTVATIVRALMQSRGLATGVVTGLISLPICGTSTTGVDIAHTKAFALTLALLAQQGSSMVKDAHASEFYATSSFCHGASIVVGKDTLKVTSTTFPTAHAAIDIAQSVRRLRDGENVWALLKEFEPVIEDKFSSDGAEFTKQRLLQRTASVGIPAALNDKECQDTGVSVLDAIIDPITHLHTTSRSESKLELGFMKLLARVRYFSSQASRSRFSRVIDQVILMTNFVPRIERNPQRFLNRMCGFVTLDQRRFVECVRGYVMMVTRVLAASPSMTERFLVMHTSMAPINGDNIAERLFESYRAAAVATVQTVVTYRALAANDTASFDDARTFAKRILAAPDAGEDDGDITQEAAELRIINAGIDRHLRRDQTGKDMTLLSALYFELKQKREPRDRELVAMLVNCIALRHLRHMINTEIHNEYSQEALTARDTVVGLAGFTAMMSFCTEFGEVKMCSIVNAVRAYATSDNVIPCTMTVVNELGVSVNAMEHTLNLCDGDHKNAFARTLRTSVERVANMVISTAHGKANLQFMLGRAYPQGMLNSEEAIAFAQQADELPKRKQRIMQVKTNAELAAEVDIGFMEDLDTAGIDDSRCCVRPIVEEVKLTTIFKFMQEHRDTDMKFLFSEGGSIVEVSDDPVVYRANVYGELVNSWRRLKEIMVSVGKKGLKNGLLLDDTQNPPEVDESTMRELEEFGRKMTMQIDYTVADERLATLDCIMKGGTAAEAKTRAKLSKLVTNVSTLANSLKNDIRRRNSVKRKAGGEEAELSAADQKLMKAVAPKRRKFKAKNAPTIPDIEIAQELTELTTVKETATTRRGRPSNEARREKQAIIDNHAAEVNALASGSVSTNSPSSRPSTPFSTVDPPAHFLRP